MRRLIAVALLGCLSVLLTSCRQDTLVLGDSITNGYPDVPVEQRWAQRAFPGAEVIAKNGWAAVDAAAAVDERAGQDPPVAKPERLVLAFGVNDWRRSFVAGPWARVSVDDFGAALVRLLVFYRPERCVVVFPWGWRGVGVSMGPWRDRARDVARRFGCRWVDLYGVWPDAPVGLAPDGVHPNVAGHGAWASMVVK